MDELQVGNHPVIENIKTFVLENAVPLARNWSVFG